MQWMPEHGKRYEWWPGLGGWDVRHGQDENLRKEMNEFGVDLAVYSKGLFPKQRIAGYRLDMNLIKKQLENGCNCEIDKKTIEIVEQLLHENELSKDCILYLGQLYTRLTKDRKKALGKKKGDQIELFPYEGDKAPEDLHQLSLTYKKLLSSSSKASKEISPCKWVAKSCDCCNKLSLAPQWWSQGLYDYAYFMIQPEFKEDVAELIARSKVEDVAICCCESLYYKCHRSLISDYCAFIGVESYHLFANNRTKFHTTVLGDRLERYPSDILEIWKSWK